RFSYRQPETRHGGARKGSPALRRQSRGVRPGRRLRRPAASSVRKDATPEPCLPRSPRSGGAALALMDAIPNLKAEFRLLGLLLCGLPLLGGSIASNTSGLNTAEAHAAKVDAKRLGDADTRIQNLCIGGRAVRLRDDLLLLGNLGGKLLAAQIGRASCRER